MTREYYRTVMQSYQGDNEITIGMRQDVNQVFCEMFGDKDEETRKYVGYFLTKAMRARTFKGFEKCLNTMLDLYNYPIELSNYLTECRRFREGLRKTWPLDK